MSSPKELDLIIDDLAFGGDGVGRVDGKACFVPFVLPGERCRVRVIEDKKKYLRADLLEVIEPSLERIPPVCPVFGHCGGCQYQHVSYSAELRIKENQVRQLLLRLGAMEHVEIAPIIPSPEPYGYRNRVRLHLREGSPGFLAHASNRHVPITSCPLASESINRQIQQLARRATSQEGQMTLRDKDSADHRGFTQVNRFLLDELLKQVENCLPPLGERFLELYAGGGFFTQRLAPRYRQVDAVEWDSRLVEVGRRDSPMHVTWWEQSVEEAMLRMEVDEPMDILTDPPREGMNRLVVEKLKSIPAGRLIYVSCNPATLARDLKYLAPEWSVRWVKPIDMFPRTAHVECIAVCERNYI
ncbi:MAG: class I SAM-dependent RNA methyltransferase [Candidatus Methylacidiphilales bacterium]